MKCLADENLNRSVVEWLRVSGYDVLWAAESHVSEADDVLLRIAANEQRLVITSDLDFGQLVFQDQLHCCGVILLRLESVTAKERLDRLIEVWAVIESNRSGCFIVVTPQKVRVRSL